MVDHKINVEEILKIRSRRINDSPETELLRRLIFIQDAYKKRDPDNQELLRYFPIAIVACIESYFRLAIKEIIDSGEPYLSNSQEIVSKMNTGFEVLKALHGQSITIGDIISHSIPISSLSHLDSHMTKLLGFDFLQKMSQIHDRWTVEVLGKSKQPILIDAKITLRYVQRTFELRHIFCHETASKYEFEVEEIEKCFEHSANFLKAAGELINQTLTPNSPMTQTDMNIASFKDYEEERKHLDSLLSQVPSLLNKKQILKFRKANKLWELFLKTSVEIEGLRYEGGSIRPTIENLCAASLIKERSKEILRFIESLRIDN
jgi:hypothetical protein